MLNFPIKVNGITLMSEDVYKKYRDGGNRKNATEYIIAQTNCSDKEAEEVIQDLIDMVKSQYQPKPFKKQEPKQTINETKTIIYKPTSQPTPPLPTCPRCGSTSITTGARGVSGFLGFIGASKTVNRCANCGHTWTPKG